MVMIITVFLLATGDGDTFREVALLECVNRARSAGATDSDKAGAFRSHSGSGNDALERSVDDGENDQQDNGKPRQATFLVPVEFVHVNYPCYPDLDLDLDPDQDQDLDPDLDPDPDPDLDLDQDPDQDQDLDPDNDLDLDHLCLRPLSIVVT